MRALFDTNILVDYLNGVEAARREIALYEKPMISPITWMEVMVGTTPDDEQTNVPSYHVLPRSTLMGKSQKPRFRFGADIISGCRTPSSGRAQKKKTHC